MKKKILVLGGYGAYGKHICRALATDPQIDCIAAGRNPPVKPLPFGVRSVALDIASAASVRATLSGMYAVVNVSSPSYVRDYTVAEQCAGLGVHYVDLADSREYIAGFARLHQVAEDKGAMLITAAGFAPTVSAMLVDVIAREFDHIDEVHVQSSAGNRNPRGEASLRAVLYQAGRVMRIKEQGRWTEAYGWSRPLSVSFPRPVGRRRLYLCDSPELDIFPERYHAQTVTNRYGFELNRFNFGLSLLSWLRRRRDARDLTRFSGTLIRAARLFGMRGSDHDGYGVVVKGRVGGQAVTQGIYLIGRNGTGPMIPCSPAITLVKRWVHGGAVQPGATTCLDRLSFDDLKATLIEHDIVLVRV